MSESQKTTTQPKGSLSELINKKIHKEQRNLLKLERLMVYESDKLNFEFFAEEADCRLCAEFLVLTVKKSCCGPCFNKWINDVGNEYEMIVCRLCHRPITSVLSDRGIKLIWQEVYFINKNIEESGHFSYPVLNQAAMDKLFEDMSSKSIPN